MHDWKRQIWQHFYQQGPSGSGSQTERELETRCGEKNLHHIGMYKEKCKLYEPWSNFAVLDSVGKASVKEC